MYQFSSVLASIRDRIFPSLKDHRTIQETASRTCVCGESVGHTGVVKSNAFSTAEFDPPESNRQGLALLLRCSAASPIPPAFSPSSRMLLFLSKQRLAPVFDFQIQALQETPGNSYLGSTGKHFTASNCHFHAFNCLWKCYSSKTCSDWCVTKPQWILTLGSLNGDGKRVSLRTQILNLPLQNRGSEKNNPGSSASQTLSKQPISCFHFWGVSDHSGSDRCCTLNTSIWLWIRSTERCFSPHTQLSLPIYCCSDEWPSTLPAYWTPALNLSSTPISDLSSRSRRLTETGPRSTAYPKHC